MDMTICAVIDNPFPPDLPQVACGGEVWVCEVIAEDNRNLRVEVPICEVHRNILESAYGHVPDESELWV